MACVRLPGGSGGASPRASTVRGRAATRRWLRLAAAAAAVGVGWLATVPAAASQPGARSHPWIAITSLSPATATPKGKVVVSGIVANPTPETLQALTVQLWSSDLALSSRSAMNGYLNAAGPASLAAQSPGARLT